MANAPRTNGRAGTCCVCKASVAVGDGYIQKNEQGRWLVYCSSDKCLPADMQDGIKNADRKYMTEDGKVFMPAPWTSDAAGQAKTLVKGLAGARWNGDASCWQVSTDLEHRPRLIEVAKKIGLELPDALLNAAAHPAAEAAKKLATERGGYDYQIEGAAWLAPLSNAVLGDDMGLGKTVQALFALDPKMGTIIVVPASVKYNWKKEIERWRPEFTATVLEGRGAWQWPGPGEAVITNPDILPKWLDPTKETSFKNFQGRTIKYKVADISEADAAKAANVTLIADEIQMFKNPKAARSKRLKELRRVCAKGWGLTGTALDNKPSALWNTFNVFGIARKVFGNWDRFKKLFNAYENGFGGIEWGLPSAEVPARLRRYMLRRLKSDVMKDLPPKQYQTIEVPVTSKRLQKQMDKLHDEWGDVMDGGSLPPFEAFSEVRAALAKDRTKAALDLVETFESNDTPLLVFSAHKAPINAIASREGWDKITGDTSNERRFEIVEAFQAGKLKGVACTIRAAGVGLTLTHSSHSLFIDLDWNPSWNWQAEDRNHRIGQTNAVNIIRMVSKHPLDQHILNLLSQKITTFQAAMEESPDKLTWNAPKGPGITKVTDADHEAKMGAILKAEEVAKQAEEDAKRQQVEDAVPQWLDRQRSRAKLPEPELTEAIKPIIREAYAYMRSICDGAETRDKMGFNKPDAATANLLAMTGMVTDDQLRVAERMLSRYSRQLRGTFPALFVKKAKYRKANTQTETA